MNYSAHNPRASYSSMLDHGRRQFDEARQLLAYSAATLRDADKLIEQSKDLIEANRA